MNIQKLITFFSWKQNPSSVFLLAIPLAMIGFGSMLSLAILQFVKNNDPWFLVIFCAGMGLLAFGLWPMRKFIFSSK